MNEALPQFEFVELIGVGGMGAVYKARQPKLNRYVAIKILPPIPDDELGFAERFEREAQAMAQLSHPHIVSVYDFGETKTGQLYFVMEYIEGADLHQLISGGELTLDHFFGWIPQVCDAIQYAHDRGIVHRDIKPANILIDREGRVRIADFGLAKLIGGDQPQTALTLADLSMGTPDYAAPEQMEASADIDWRSDIYSLGIVMYQMLTGRLPRGAFPLPSEGHPEIDPRLDEVVIRAMQSEPGARFQHASEISDQLTGIRHTPVPPDVPSTSTPPPRGKGKSLLPLVAAVVGISIVVGAIFAGIRKKRNPPALPKAPPIAAAPSPGPTGKKPAGPTDRTKPKTSKPVTGNHSPPESEAAPQDPPRDFSRRPESGNKGGRSGNIASFRDKLGRKPQSSGRRSVANLSVVSRNGGEIIDAGPLAELPRDLKPITQLAIGQSPLKDEEANQFVLALQVNGEIRSWGDNTWGQLDPPEEIRTVVQVAAGATHALALLKDGTVIGWGDDRLGQCQVPSDLGPVEKIGAGKDFSVALKADGTVVAWGASEASVVPTEADNVVDIAVGFTHCAALGQDGRVITWGSNERGQLEQPDALAGVSAIASTLGNTFALSPDRGIVSWGASGFDQADPEIPIVEIYGAGDSLVARDEKDRLILYGRNGKPTPLPSPLRLMSREIVLILTNELIFAYRPATPSAQTTGVPDTPVRSSEVTSTALAIPDSPPALESQTEASLAIAELQEKLEQAYFVQVSGPWESAIGQLNDFYLNHLEERQSEAASSADLDAALAWRSEAERVRAGDPLPETDEPGLHPDLLSLRQTYRQKAAEYEITRVEAEKNLLTMYDEALQSMQDRFTAEEKLDDALEVKTFREGLGEKN